MSCHVPRALVEEVLPTAWTFLSILLESNDRSNLDSTTLPLEVEVEVALVLPVEAP